MAGVAEGIELKPLEEEKFEADDTEDDYDTTSFENPAFDAGGYIEDDYIGSAIGEPQPGPSWARGEEMPELLDEENLASGDF